MAAQKLADSSLHLRVINVAQRSSEGGASVAFFSDPAEKVTFARITRHKGRYRMRLFTGSFVRFGKEGE